MPRVLLVTNDFPPTIGGIQSYLRDFIETLLPQHATPIELFVFASTQDPQAAAAWDAQQQYKITRWPHKVMLPTPATARAMAELIRKHQIDVVWFGAAAPLALMARTARRAGATKILASTHGHEVGWSMLPVARQLLRRIGNSVDVITYVSEYARRRFASAFGNHPSFVHLPSGVDTDWFHPITPSMRTELRKQLHLPSHGPIIVCVSRLVPRKGQDQLIRVFPSLAQQFPAAHLVIVGQGRYEKKLRQLAQDNPNIIFTGRVSQTLMREYIQVADVVAMPCRTRGYGLDVEGLGIVYLEAQACGVAVIAGDSGGAPETITPETGWVVAGKNRAQLLDVLSEACGDLPATHAKGAIGRTHVTTSWTWERMGQRLRGLLEENPRSPGSR